MIHKNCIDGYTVTFERQLEESILVRCIKCDEKLFQFKRRTIYQEHNILCRKCYIELRSK